MATKTYAHPEALVVSIVSSRRCSTLIEEMTGEGFATTLAQLRAS